MDGLLLLTLGLFMKVVVADSMLAATADYRFQYPGPDACRRRMDRRISVFRTDIFRFAGYSTCAVGVALCLGFVLPQNFNYPYAARGSPISGAAGILRYHLAEGLPVHSPRWQQEGLPGCTLH